MLPSGKVAVLFLVACMVSPDLVTSKKTMCTREQRKSILQLCDFFIKPGHPTHLVSRDSPCYAAVREVQDMECVILLLSETEKKKYSVQNIRVLRGLCEEPPGHMVTCTNEQKEAVLHDCEKFIKHGNPRLRPIPVMGQPCCNAVNKVPKKGAEIDMQCIVDLLTDEDKHHHDASKILNLPNHC